MSLKERISEGENFIIEQKSRIDGTALAKEALKVDGADGIAYFSDAPKYYNAAGVAVSCAGAAGPTGATGPTGAADPYAAAHATGWSGAAPTTLAAALDRISLVLGPIA